MHQWLLAYLDKMTTIFFKVWYEYCIMFPYMFYKNTSPIESILFKERSPSNLKWMRKRLTIKKFQWIWNNSNFPFKPIILLFVLSKCYVFDALLGLFCSDWAHMSNHSEFSCNSVSKYFIHWEKWYCVVIVFLIWIIALSLYYDRNRVYNLLVWKPYHPAA